VPNLPLVSVVVPSFNHEELIEECLRSVVAQSWPRLELIVVDDASRDSTFARAERLASAPAFRQRFEDRVHLERNPKNLGAHGTLNRALGLARGDFVGILNSDDRYAPARVATLMKELEDGSPLAFSAVRLIDRSSRDITEEDWFALRLSHSQRSVRAFPSVGFALLKENVCISTGNLFFRRRLFDQVGGFRPLLYCHDWDFLLRSVLVAEPVFVPLPLYEYRIHESNSYRALSDVALRETETVLSAYFSAVQRGSVTNDLAPTPANWPGLFDTMMSALGLWRYWDQARRCSVV
jgi:glycosyltransferase involved in cell wall biosynthesis